MKLALSNYQKEKISRLDKGIARSRYAPLLASLIPFAPVILPLAVSAIAGGYTLNLQRKILGIEAEDTTDSRYQEKGLNPGDISKQTYFGEAIPMGDWKRIIQNTHDSEGSVSPARRRELLDDVLTSRAQPFLLDDNLLTRHLAIMALTGSGKTELIKALAYQQINKPGGGMILVEAKSDSDLSGTLYQMCKEANRLDDFYLINFEQPNLSHTYNPFYSGGVREMIGSAMRIQGKSNEEFWSNVNRYAFTAIMLTLKCQPGMPPFNIKDFVACLQDFEILYELVMQIDKSESAAHKDAYDWLVLYLDFWRDKDKGGYRTKDYEVWLNGAVAKFSSFAHSEYSSIVNTYQPDIEIIDAILNGKILVLSMSAMKDKDGVEQFARLFLADVARAIGTIQQEKLKPISMCPLFCDEYGSFADISHLEFFQLARSANVPCIIAMQGKGFLSAVDENFAENVLGNCWHHIYCDVRDTETREFASKMAGTHMIRLSTHTEGESAGVSLGSESSGLLTQDSEGTSESVGWREQREELIIADDFIDLDEGDAIVVGKSGAYRMRMPMVVTPNVPSHWNEMELVRPKRLKKSGIGAWDRRVKRAEMNLNRMN